MAAPRNASIQRGAPLRNGILLGVSPSSDPTCDVELARASSSGVYATLARLSPKGQGVAVVYTDLLPLTTAAWSYKARAVKDGWVEGDYTAAVTARAISLPEILPNITPLTGKGIGSPLFITTGASPTYGSKQTPSAYSKGFIIYPNEFGTSDSGLSYAADFNTLYPKTTSATAFYTRVNVPANATVDDITFYYNRGSTKPVIQFRAKYQFNVPVVLNSTYFSYVSTAVTGSTHTKSFSSGFLAPDGLYLQVNMTSTSGTNTSVQLRKVFVSYSIPNVAI